MNEKKRLEEIEENQKLEKFTQKVYQRNEEENLNKIKIEEMKNKIFEKLEKEQKIRNLKFEELMTL